jgi:hypothetical protein
MSYLSYNPEAGYSTHKSQPPDPILSQFDPIQSTYTSLIHILILPFHPCLDLQSVLKSVADLFA